jgi:signal transduction histidine kinase/CheY-like chemotaxis protein/HPt (histidine-containing phosphotransfer) domain-containing protein
LPLRSAPAYDHAQTPVQERAPLSTRASKTRLRDFRALMLVSGGLLSGYAVRNATLGRPRTAITQGIATAIAIAIAIFAGRAKTDAGRRRVVHASLGAATVLVGLISVLTGQQQSVSAFMLSAIGPIAAYVLGVRAAVFWAFAGFGMVVLGYYWDGWLGLVPEFTQRSFERVSQHASIHVSLLLLALLARHAFDRKLEELAVRERTIRRQAEDLELARDRALAASRAKSEFLATMSHEIRTPLNGVLGMTTLLGDTALSREQAELVEIIRASGDALLATLNEILDFTKIEAERLELERAPFVLRDAVEGALELFAATAAARGLELTAVVADDVPPQVVGDAARVQQMLANLIGNAVKFTERGEVVVDVGRARGDAARLRFDVRDTGIGVAQERKALLFEAFTQADTSTTRRFGGTGLGLAIVRRLAEMMNGHAFVESALGEGSRFGFEIELPAAPDAPAPELGRLSDVRVAVVQTHPAAREGLVTTLRSLGVRPSPFADAAAIGDEALEQAQVALLDVAATADAALRARLQARGVPIVALARLGAARERDPIVFLPARRAALVEALSRALGRLTDSAPSRSERPFASAVVDAPLRVLVADDNPVSQRVARLFLERLGHRADVVGSGAEALEALRQRRYDVLLTDLAMPDVDGLTAARRIRAELPADVQPRIIAMTASTLPEHRDACVRAGMDDFVAKPVQVAELVQALRRAPRLGTPRPFEAPMARVAEALLDVTRIDALATVSGSTELLAEIFGDFTSNARRLVSTMADAAARDDANALGRAAHALKGNAGTFGATAVSARAERIEHALRDASAGALTGEIEALRGALEATARTIEARVAR